MHQTVPGTEPADDPLKVDLIIGPVMPADDVIRVLRRMRTSTLCAFGEKLLRLAFKDAGETLEVALSTTHGPQRDDFSEVNSIAFLKTEDRRVVIGMFQRDFAQRLGLEVPGGRKCAQLYEILSILAEVRGMIAFAGHVSQAYESEPGWVTQVCTDADRRPVTSRYMDITIFSVIVPIGDGERSMVAVDGSLFTVGKGTLLRVLERGERLSLTGGFPLEPGDFLSPGVRIEHDFHPAITRRGIVMTVNTETGQVVHRLSHILDYFPDHDVPGGMCFIGQGAEGSGVAVRTNDARQPSFKLAPVTFDFVANSK